MVSRNVAWVPTRQASAGWPGGLAVGWGVAIGMPSQQPQVHEQDVGFIFHLAD
jgi:hypothetical protein